MEPTPTPQPEVQPIQPPVPPAAPEKKFWNVDKLVGSLALIVSLSSLGTLLYQTLLMRKQQHASVMPYLELWNTSPNAGEYRLVLVNNGIGPAFVKQVRVHYKGVAYQGDHTRFFWNVLQKEDSTYSYSLYSNIGSGRVIPAGQDIELFLVKDDSAAARKLRGVFGENIARIEITYASVYDELWRLNGVGEVPLKLED
jgi:hypothetical protein